MVSAKLLLWNFPLVVHAFSGLPLRGGTRNLLQRQATSTLQSTTANTTFEVSRYKGLEDDFILIDERDKQQSPILSPEGDMSSSEHGRPSPFKDSVVIALEPPTEAFQYHMHIYNSDGKEKEVYCNGVKCIHTLADELAHDHKVTVEEFKSWLVQATGTATEKPTKDVEEDYHTWNEDTMSQAIRKMQYAVRGQLVSRAETMAAEGKDVLFTNIGNPQAVGQTPITYYRQVMALCDLPAEAGVDHPAASDMFPADVIQRAREMREALGPSGTGAYTGSQGVLAFRQDVADFIAERDGHPSYPGNIFLTNGASSAIELVMTCLISSELDGIMIPIPQYPIYSALIAKLSGSQVSYELDESRSWAAATEELERRLAEAQKDGVTVKALAIINPGNPTGQVFSREDLEVICKFCAENGIVLLADEVYQRNVYATGKEFVSAKKVALETPGCESLQLVSFHSTSKGIIGECGKRGGYMELHNIDPYVQSQLYKLASSGLCSNVPGQVMTSLMVKPPRPGDASYESFVQEERAIFEGLQRRAKALEEGLSRVEGMDCNPAEGAMYAFPRVQLPPKALEHAKREGMTPDTMYALSLLEETGLCVVPASGFGQKEGRVGFRTTFLPPDEKMMHAIDQFACHHKRFCAKFS